jgi:hypothetical protein
MVGGTKGFIVDEEYSMPTATEGQLEAGTSALESSFEKKDHGVQFGLLGGLGGDGLELLAEHEMCDICVILRQRRGLEE